MSRWISSLLVLALAIAIADDLRLRSLLTERTQPPEDAAAATGSRPAQAGSALAWDGSERGARHPEAAVPPEAEEASAALTASRSDWHARRRAEAQDAVDAFARQSSLSEDTTAALEESLLGALDEMITLREQALDGHLSSDEAALLLEDARLGLRSDTTDILGTERAERFLADLPPVLLRAVVGAPTRSTL